MVKNIRLEPIRQSHCDVLLEGTRLENTPVLIPALHYPSPPIYSLYPFATNEFLQIGDQNCCVELSWFGVGFMERVVRWSFNLPKT